MLATLHRSFVVSSTLILAACGGGLGAEDDDDSPVLFHFKVRGQPDDDFLATISDRGTKAQARDELELPARRRKLFPAGVIARTNGGYNFDWSWHFRGSVGLAEVSVEACQTTPALIEANLAYWVASPVGACPVGAYVYAEAR